MMEKWVKWTLLGTAAAALFLGLLPLPTGLLERADQIFPAWQNLSFVQAALTLTGLSWLLYLALHQGQPAGQLIPFQTHLFRLALLVHLAFVAVLLWKYVSFAMPDTYTNQLIYLYSVQKKSLIDLYTRSWPGPPPILTPIYPPGIYIFLRTLYAFLGESVFVPRFVSSLGILGVAGGLFLAMPGRRGWEAMVPAGLFLALFPLLLWSGPPTKPEFVAAAASTAGFAIFLRNPTGGSRSNLILSSLFFGICLLVKFTLIAGFATIALTLLFRRRWMAFLYFIVPAAVLFWGVFLFIGWFSDGGLFFFTISGNAVQATYSKIISFGILGFLPQAFVVIVLAVGAAYFPLRADFEAENLVLLAFIIALLFFLYAVGRPGSSRNYFLEPLIYGCLLFGCYLAGNREASVFVQVLLLVLLVVNLPAQAALLARSYDPPEVQAAVDRQLASLDMRPDQFILADVYYVYDVIQAGRVPLILDNFQYTLLNDNGLINSKELREALASDTIPYLVLERSLEEHALLPYGGRYFPTGVIPILIQSYRCSEILTRWDGAKLIICARKPE